MDNFVDVTVVMAEPRLRLPRICSGGVAILTPFDSVVTSYQVVASLKASGDWDGVGNTKLYRAQAAEAARLGANAIIVGKLSEATRASRLVELGTGWKQQRWASATAISIPADSARVRAACLR